MKTRTKIVLAVVFLTAGGLVTWRVLRGPDPTLVHTARAERVERLRALVNASGDIRAKEFVDIQSEVAAVITQLPVKEGDPVQKGQRLLKLDDRQLQADVDGARAMLAATEAEATSAAVGIATATANEAAQKTALANLRVELEQARITQARSRSSFERKKELLANKVMSAEDFEVAEAEFRILERKLEWATARVEQGEAELNAAASRVTAARAGHDGALRRVDNARAVLARVQDLLGKTEICSPLTGLITKLNVEVGERAVPGIQSNPQATLMTIADMSVVEAEIRVGETDIVHVALGACAEVEVDALRDLKLKGCVTEIGQSPIQASSFATGAAQNQEAKDFKVVVRLESPPPALRPGMSASADIITATRDDVLVVPLQSLTVREADLDGEGRYVPPPRQAPGSGVANAALSSHNSKKKEFDGVFVIEAGVARFKSVKKGITGDMDVEILEGLTAATEVITGPFKSLRTLREWDPVKVDTDEKRKRDEEFRMRKRRK